MARWRTAGVAGQQRAVLRDGALVAVAESMPHAALIVRGMNQVEIAPHRYGADPATLLDTIFTMAVAHEGQPLADAVLGLLEGIKLGLSDGEK